jgi:hypothetical protein
MAVAGALGAAVSMAAGAACSTAGALAGCGVGAAVSGATVGSAFALAAWGSGARLVLRRGRFGVAIVILTSFSALCSGAGRAQDRQSVGQPMVIT